MLLCSARELSCRFMRKKRKCCGEVVVVVVVVVMVVETHVQDAQLVNHQQPEPLHLQESLL